MQLNESGIPYLDPESKTVLDSLTWSDRVMPGGFGIVGGPVT